MEGKMQGFEGIFELDYALSQIPINPMRFIPGADAEDMARIKRNAQSQRENYRNRVKDFMRRWKEFQERKNQKN
jgi:hypothetical protein